MINLQAGKIIKDARKEKGWTQDEVAAMLAKQLGNYSTRHYQNLEKGKFPIYKEKVVSVVEEILDIKISELIYGNNEAHDSDPEPYLIDSQNNTTDRPGEFIYVSAIAQAEYPTRFQDSNFIKNLPLVHLPGIIYQGEQYRVFEVKKDSMMRHHIGDYLICSRIDINPPFEIINYGLHTVVHQGDVVMGWLAIKNDEQFVLLNPNTNYSRQILLPLKDIKELWCAERITHMLEPIIRKFNIEI
jgi:transcriptional regulator with XRE-family HTH domain